MQLNRIEWGPATNTSNVIKVFFFPSSSSFLFPLVLSIRTSREIPGNNNRGKKKNDNFFWEDRTELQIFQNTERKGKPKMGLKNNNNNKETGRN